MRADVVIGNQPSAIVVAVYISLAAYLLAFALLAGSGSHPHLRGIARWCWTVGAAALAIHVAAAFHYEHRWSHAAAYVHTAKQTAAATGWSWGGGLWFNYLVTVAWMIDAAAWSWLGDERYSHRPRWLAFSWHVFLAFMWFNAAVIFAHSSARYVALAGFATVALLLIRRAATGRMA